VTVGFAREEVHKLPAALHEIAECRQLIASAAAREPS